jgi:hypothetical protein
MKINLDSNTLQNQLSEVAVESVQPLSVDAQCRLLLRALVTEGVNRMILEERTGDADVALASANLKHFVREMKVESVFLGYPERLSYDSFCAARERMGSHALLTPFTLWPFWPNEYVVGNKR